MALLDGWSTIGWTGPDAPAEQVAGTLGAARIVAFVDGSFSSFDRNAPAPLNTLDVVTNGLALWVLSIGDRTATIPDAAPPPSAAPEPAPPPVAANCHPSYPTVCIPPLPPDLNCGDIPFRRFPVIGADPHRFDTDGDGIGCES